ncbi:GNAT family N-acetyltransferase [Nocardioides sp. InS609-2]|uniref:GNAT family N-acetyltransferase n=1 Tax=Nocardioides sp. InS609-2 TaxID=2760705 RepID=UPI0020BE5A0D|nr:GNAT family N-acetyltransferase [Nocardioides sp. InS609-2]
MAADFPDPFVVRDATRDDIPTMSAIYGREAKEGHAPFDIEPRSDQAWASYVDSRAPGDFALVAADAASGVVGYAYSTSYRPNPAYVHTRESTIYVDPSAQGRGIGHALYAELLGRMRGAGVHVVIAGIALPNEPSIKMHLSCGFEPIGTFREVGRKFGRWIDVEFYELRL